MGYFKSLGSSISRNYRGTRSFDLPFAPPSLLPLFLSTPSPSPTTSKPRHLQYLLIHLHQTLKRILPESTCTHSSFSLFPPSLPFPGSNATSNQLLHHSSPPLPPYPSLLSNLDRLLLDLPCLSRSLNDPPIDLYVIGALTSPR